MADAQRDICILLAEHHPEKAGAGRAEAWDRVPNKLAEHFSDRPGSGDVEAVGEEIAS